MTFFPSINPDLVNPGITVRVYGILINEKQQVLVSDEYYYGKFITKLPGGGIEFGETTVECLKREWREELGVHIDVNDHVYTSDIFQTFPFRRDVQILSIYYYVQAQTALDIPVSSIPFDFAGTDNSDHRIAVRWMDVDTFLLLQMTFPADKMAIGIIAGKLVQEKEGKERG